MTVFLTSDSHYGHNRILEFCKSTRPYASVEEMDEAIIENWNSVVSKGDTVYHLGDFTFYRENEKEKVEKIFSRLNGQKHLILGNHDPKFVRQMKWAEVCNYKELRVNKKQYVLFHYPIQEWCGFFHQSILLFGHVHGNKVLPDNWKCLDVGIDGPFNRPISLEEIDEYMKDRRNERP